MSETIRHGLVLIVPLIVGAAVHVCIGCVVGNRLDWLCRPRAEIFSCSISGLLPSCLGFAIVCSLPRFKRLRGGVGPDRTTYAWRSGILPAAASTARSCRLSDGPSS